MLNQLVRLLLQKAPFVWDGSCGEYIQNGWTAELTASLPLPIDRRTAAGLYILPGHRLAVPHANDFTVLHVNPSFWAEAVTIAESLQ